MLFVSSFEIDKFMNNIKEEKGIEISTFFRKIISLTICEDY